VRQRELAGIVFGLLALLYLYWIAHDLLSTAGDEGIYLEGGRRVALGQQPYRDFFVLTGPLTFWLEGILAKAGGMRLDIMRLPVIVEAAFLAWAVYRFLSRYAGVLYSAGAAFAFLACESRLRLLNVNHRWDSAALATGAAVAALEAYRRDRAGPWAVCGALTAAAALATPSMLVLALPFVIWCALAGFRRVLAFAAGGGLVAVSAAIYLQSHHALLPMLGCLRWTASNYASPNRIAYGSFSFASAPANIWSYTLAFLWEVIPAAAPVAALVGWMCWWRIRNQRPEPEILALSAVAAALVFSAWPRWSPDALLHTMSVSWFLSALLLYRATTARQRFWVCGVAIVLSAASVIVKSFAPLDSLPCETRVGTLRDPGGECEYLAGLERWAQPGDSLFSFPYMPSLYYFLNARNPSRYSFLQPGMMTSADENQALEEVRTNPPRWVIYEDFPTEAVMAIWPGSDPARIPMPYLNAYIASHYTTVDRVAGPWGRVAVMERTPDR
jgi:hypothetical protein